MNCFGALGKLSSCGSPLKFSQRSMISSLVGFFSKFTNTAAVCPSSTGTRIHCVVINGAVAFSILPSTTLPNNLNGSYSDFSSSPPMNGMMFSTISGQSLNVFPAPEIAWYVVATTSLGPNSFNAKSAGA